MAKQAEARPQAQAVPEALVPPAFWWGQQNGEGVKVLMSSYETAMQRGAQINEQLLSFLSSRMEDDLQTSRKLADCSNLSEAMMTQVAFLKRMEMQYLEEASKLSAMAGEMMQACCAPLWSQVERLAEQGNGNGKGD